jgi:hypothetical protein
VALNEEQQIPLRYMHVWRMVGSRGGGEAEGRMVDVSRLKECLADSGTLYPEPRSCLHEQTGYLAQCTLEEVFSALITSSLFLMRLRHVSMTGFSETSTLDVRRPQ